MPDIEKIKIILEQLNAIHGPGKGYWVEAAGYHALLAMEIKNNIFSIIPGSSMGLKVFVNTETGELKTYLANTLDVAAGAVPPGAVTTNG